MPPHRLLRLLLMLFVLAPPTIARADVIECIFTEPYLAVVHDTVLATVEMRGLAIETQTFTGVGLTLTGVNAFSLSWDDQRLDLQVDYQGSDQMSDQVFPISARLGRADEETGTRHGGCWSTRLPMIIPIDA